jgi:hypothetical protein
VVEAWETEGSERLPASWQAVTCVNAETAPKDTMRRPTLLGPGIWGKEKGTSLGRKREGKGDVTD